MKYALSVDIGASSGRHIVGWYEGGEIKTEELYRFPNGMDTLDGHLIWDTDRLLSEVKQGLKLAFEKYPEISSMSIDTWGVDYVLLKGDEEVKPTYAYRDSRVDEPINEVHRIIPFDELYSRTGIQFNTFNTIYQLYADKIAGRFEGVTDFLMIPEYLMYKLTGVKKKEFTDATTTGLVNYKTLELDGEIFARLGLPLNLIQPLSAPGTFVGRLKPEIAKEVGSDLDVVLCATHDTASAVEAIDMETNSPYISSGTWSLLGVKTDEALTDEGSRLSDYSNEGGV
ncbi:MAG: rhamnulokinase, partial [Clostridia bacterium]|nr:rhamnulokinase [Clostridia bacterium]